MAYSREVLGKFPAGTYSGTPGYHGTDQQEATYASLRDGDGNVNPSYAGQFIAPDGSIHDFSELPNPTEYARSLYAANRYLMYVNEDGMVIGSLPAITTANAAAIMDTYRPVTGGGGRAAATPDTTVVEHALIAPVGPPVPVSAATGEGTQAPAAAVVPHPTSTILEDGTVVESYAPGPQPVDTHPDTVRYDGGSNDEGDAGAGVGSPSSGGSGLLVVGALVGAYLLFGRRR